MRTECSEDDFYAAIGPMDLTAKPTGTYPYTTEFRDRHGRLVGRRVSEIPAGTSLPVYRYLLEEVR